MFRRKLHNHHDESADDYLNTEFVNDLNSRGFDHYYCTQHHNYYCPLHHHVSARGDHDHRIGDDNDGCGVDHDRSGDLFNSYALNAPLYWR